MGIDHQPTPGPNENNDNGPLTQEFSLFLKSDPMRAQKLVLELSITRFCDELEGFGNVSLQGLVRLFSTQPRHKAVQEIYDFFSPCFDAGEEELRKRLEVVFAAVESTVPEHVALSHESASLTKDAFCGILLCQSALCIGSYELSKVIRDTGLGIDKSIIEPFWERIDDEGARIVRINLSENLTTALKRKSTEALANHLVEESKKLKLTINSRIEELKNLYEPLTAYAVERLLDIVPPQLEEYLQQPFKEALTRYTRAEFETPFNSEISKIHQQKFYDIDAALRAIRELMR
jgi:hypothetical protein